MAVSGPLEGELPQIVVQRLKGGTGHHRPVVGRPAAHDRVDLAQHRRGVGPSQGLHLDPQPVPDASHRSGARFDQQLVVVVADVEPQEVEASIDGHDSRLVLVEGQTPGRQPRGKLRLDLERLLTAVTQDDEVIGVSHEHHGVRHRLDAISAEGAISNSCGLFHPVQSDVEQQR